MIFDFMIFTFMQNKNLLLLTWIHNDNKSSSKLLSVSIPLPFFSISDFQYMMVEINLFLSHRVFIGGERTFIK